jgi:hypothetical protein
MSTRRLSTHRRVQTLERKPRGSLESEYALPHSNPGSVIARGNQRQLTGSRCANRAQEKPRQGESDEGTSLLSGVSLKLNPLVPILSPAQQIIGQLLVYLRATTRVLTWADTIVTAWLYFGLVILTVLLALVPWAPVCHLGLRALGALVLGPHMHLVGRYLDRRADEEQKEEEAYAAADSAGKEAILAKKRAALLLTAQQKLAAAATRRGQRSAHARQLAEFLDDARNFNLALAPARTSGRHKYVTMPDTDRSRAYPRPGA